MNTETDSAVLFLNVWVIRKGCAMDTKGYRKRTHTGHKLHFQPNHPSHVKSCVELLQYAKSNKTVMMKHPEIRATAPSLSQWIYWMSYQQIEEKYSSE
jgi:hypothetical protein